MARLFSPHLASLAAILVLGLLVLGLGIQVVSRPLDFDEAVNLQVALNLLLAGKYQSWYHAPVPFNPIVTTGPAVLLPIGLLFRLLDSSSVVLARLWVLAFFLPMAWLLAREFFRRQADSGQGLVGLCCLVCTVLLFLLPGIEHVSVVGEGPGISLLSLAFALLRSQRPSRHLLAGLCLGLAILSKLLFALSLAAVLLGLVVELANGTWPRRAALRKYATVLAAAAATLGLWQLALLTSLGWEGYQGHRISSAAFFREQTSQGGSILDRAATILPCNLKILARYVGPLPLAVLALAATTLVGRTAVRLWQGRVIDPTPLLCLGYGIGHLAWWLLADAIGSERHLFPGLVFLYLGIFLHLAHPPPRPALALLVAALLAGGPLAAQPTTLSSLADFFRLQADRRRLLAVTQETAGAVSLLARQGVTIFGADWWQVPEISYLARTPFRDLGRQPDVSSCRPASCYVLVNAHVLAWARDFEAERTRLTAQQCGGTAVSRDQAWHVSHGMATLLRHTDFDFDRILIDPFFTEHPYVLIPIASLDRAEK